MMMVIKMMVDHFHQTFYLVHFIKHFDSFLLSSILIGVFNAVMLSTAFLRFGKYFVLSSTILDKRLETNSQN